MNIKHYEDRKHAGAILAEHLKKYAMQKDVIILALPRGGVPVAFEVAQALQVPLIPFIVRKLGLPSNEEVAMGAIASGGGLFLDEDLIRHYDLDSSLINKIIKKEQKELKRRERLYLVKNKNLSLKGKKIILVDDGMATGATIKVALSILTKQNPAKIIIAVPLAPKDVYDEIYKQVDELVCPLISDLQAVSLCYTHFPQTSDEEVCELLTGFI